MLPPPRSFLPLLPGLESRRRRALLALLLAAFVWHVACLASLQFGTFDSWFNDSTSRIGRGADFFAVYEAGADFLGNEALFASWGTIEHAPYAFPFRYVPSMAYSVGLVAGVLPAWEAYWMWVGFNQVLLAVNLYLTWRYTPSANLRFVTTSMWLLFTPFYIELYMGQFSYLMGSLFFWMGLGFLRKSTRVAGSSWAVSLIVKSNSLLFLPIWLRMRAFRVVICGLAFAALLNVPYFVVKDGSFEAWGENFSSLAGGATADYHAGALGLRNLLSVVVFLGDERGGRALDVMASAASLPIWVPAIIGVSLAATFLPKRFDPVAALALWIAVYFLTYKQVWEHHHVMLLPALVLLVMARPRLRSISLITFALLAIPTPFWVFEQISGDPGPASPFLDPQRAWSSAEIIAYHLSKVIPALMFWMFLVTHSLRPTGARSRTNENQSRAPVIDASPALG